MIPEEKAKELVDRFHNKLRLINKTDSYGKSKQCAIICVDEIINALDEQKTYTGHKIHLTRYYEEVKTEINLL